MCSAGKTHHSHYGKDNCITIKFYNCSLFQDLSQTLLSTAPLLAESTSSRYLASTPVVPRDGCGAVRISSRWLSSSGGTSMSMMPASTSISMTSPSSTTAMGPPAAASGGRRSRPAPAPRATPRPNRGTARPRRNGPGPPRRPAPTGRPPGTSAATARPDGCGGAPPCGRAAASGVRQSSSSSQKNPPRGKPKP